ncbi:MAG: leucine-rich repeat domain-containing protein [Anaerolineales bacterium]|nr:leucine-rich repeat domain-containing protein [Anaerolineales bacterium]
MGDDGWVEWDYIKFMNELEPEERRKLLREIELEHSKSPRQKASERISSAMKGQYSELHLDSLGLEDLPGEIHNLHHVTHLYLQQNKIKSLSKFIRSLRNLQYLDISRNCLTAIPMEIGQLINLTHLDISRNSLASISMEIGQLTNLTHLDISNNSLTSIPKKIGQLINLTHLDISNNSLASIPIEIGQLINLTHLNLCNNELEKIPDLRRLAHLTHLAVSNNRLSNIPESVYEIRELKFIDVSRNKLSQLSPSIGDLLNLVHLDLRFNNIKVLPQEIGKLDSLQYLDIRDNLFNIPPEILNNVGEGGVLLSLLLEYQNNTRSLDEVKLLLVGQGSVGKTSIIQRILNNTFDPHENKTNGIAINHWQASIKAETENQPSPITFNLWDFGGQEIMHATHQFFLTKRSIYLLVLDSRLSQEENRVEYWLKIIQSFGGESPVLVVGNKIDQHPLDIDCTGLQKKYPNIVGFLETSAATGAGIEELKAAITTQANYLPHVRDLLPETWFTVKTEVESLGRKANFITYDKYLELCAENDVSDETSQRTLIGFLHDLGVVLHFQDDPRLEALGILNPQWVTNGVYKIINSHALFQNKGVLTVSMLDEILNLPEYPRGKRLFIVDMMKKFELCYDIESDKTFLVPDLLPKDEPAELKFNGVPAFEYAYPVLPSSVITRFIVRMNQKINDGCVWRTGVVLKIAENKALVKADIEDRKITIAIDGLEHMRRDTLLAICTHLDEIHDSIKGLTPEKLIPVPGALNAKPLSYIYLLMLEAKGIEILPVPDGNRLIDVNIRKVLSGVPNEIRPKEAGGNVTHIHIGGNFDGNLTVGDGNQSIKDSYNKISSAKIDPELKQTLKLLAEAVSAMTKAMADEQAAEVTEDLGKLVDEATKPKPNKKWYSVSIEGLIKAAENVEKVGEPVINLSQKVLSLLTGGAIQ